MDAKDVLNFWFEELYPIQWFQGGADLDEKITDKFSALHKAAALGELNTWRTNALERLAEIIVLDQFSRNIYRGKPEAFANDQMALTLAQEMVRLKLDETLPTTMRSFAYMPYMHSESPLIHEEALRLFSQEGMEENLNFEIEHKKIIDQFGRYPHRNAILGRESTPKEEEFLKTHQGF